MTTFETFTFFDATQSFLSIFQLQGKGKQKEKKSKKKMNEQEKEEVNEIASKKEETRKNHCALPTFSCRASIVSSRLETTLLTA